MYPFFSLFGREIAMYGLMCVVAAFVSVGFAASRAKKYGVEARDVLYMSIFAVIGAIVGAKALGILIFLVQVAVHLGKIVEAGFGLWDIIFSAFAETGIVFFGGLIGGSAGGLIYLKMYKLSVPVFVDIAAPCIPLAHAVGRVGCFLAGCCYGVESKWGVMFDSPAAPAGRLLLPVQLIESDVNLLLAVVILLYERLRRPENDGRGKSLLLYLVLYSVSRFTLEFWRGDAARGLYFGISTSQIISFLIFIAATAMFRLTKTKPRGIIEV